MLNHDIIRYCAEEVSRQQDDPITVAYMLEAWEWAQESYAENPQIEIETIQAIAHLVKPIFGGTGSTRTVANVFGQWRNVGVRVGWRVCPPPQELPELMGKWMANLALGMTPEEAYREFEEIHPFIDGNGRTGKIIFNWLRGTLDAPAWPPNFWNIANP